MHAEVIQAQWLQEKKSPIQGTVQSQAYNKRFIHLHVRIGMCMRVCVFCRTPLPAPNRDAVILCKSIFLESVLLIPPLYDCTVTGLVPVML